MAEKFQLINMPDGNQMRVPEGASWEDIHERVGNYLSSLPKETIDTLPTKARLAFGLGQGAIAAQARKNMANNLAAQTAGQYDQDMTNAQMEFAGQAAAAVPAAAATLATGGLAAPAAMALMGGAGLAGGVLRESTKTLGGSSDIPETKMDLAKALSLDAVMGAMGEGAGRGIGYATKSLAPQLLQRAASKYEVGQDLLQKAFVDTRGKLTQIVQDAGRPTVDVKNVLTDLYQSLKAIPRAGGRTGARFSAPTSKASEIMGDLEADLYTSGGTIAEKQPLDGLIRMKGSLQQMAYKEKSLAPEERVAFKKAARALDSRIRTALDGLGPEAKELYDQSLQLMKTQVEHDTAVSIAERALGSMAGKAMAGGAAGGAYGYYKQGGITGALKGAAEGAAIGVGLGAANALASKAIPWTLQVVMSHPEGAKLFKNAIAASLEGNGGKSTILAARAFTVAGVRERIKDWMKSEGMPAVQPMVPPAPIVGQEQPK